MRLPWVSRADSDRWANEVVEATARANHAWGAVEALTSERDWLRAQLETALDHNRRLDRVDAKLHEVPTEPHRVREPMPKDIRDAIDSWSGEATRSRLDAEAWKRYDREGSWDGVRAQLVATEAG